MGNIASEQEMHNIIKVKQTLYTNCKCDLENIRLQEKQMFHSIEFV